MSTAPGDTTALAGNPECVSMTVGDGRAARRIAAALEELIEPAADAVACFEQTDGWRIDAYYATAPDTRALAANLSALLGIGGLDPRRLPVPDENWVAISQAALPPVSAGRFTVHGSHDRMRVGRGPTRIEIDAGEAFGTAHHATTSGCLMAIDRLAHAEAGRRDRGRGSGHGPCRVLDLGCGSGVLAIAAQRAMPRACILASDVDPVAVMVARANTRGNGAIGIECLVADGLPRSRRRSQTLRFELVIANILAGPLVLLAPRLAHAVAPGGVLVLSGLLVRQSREVLGAYLPRGFTLARRIELAGWATLTLRRRGR